MINRINSAIQICDQQIDGQNDHYAELWAEIRETLTLCGEEIGIRIECPRCDEAFFADEDTAISRCPRCDLVIG